MIADDKVQKVSMDKNSQRGEKFPSSDGKQERDQVDQAKSATMSQPSSNEVDSGSQEEELPDQQQQHPQLRHVELVEYTLAQSCMADIKTEVKNSGVKIPPGDSVLIAVEFPSQQISGIYLRS